MKSKASTSNVFTPRFLALSALVLLAACARLLPHPPNVTPVAAMALFGGAYFAGRWAAFAVPLAAMVLSDLALGAFVYGFEGLLFSRLFVYSGFAAMVALGRLIQGRIGLAALFGATVGGSVLFFLVTNLGVWLSGTLYPLTLEGFLSCYAAAIPFFRNTLLGNIAYVAVLFGSFALAERYVPALQKKEQVATA